MATERKKEPSEVMEKYGKLSFEIDDKRGFSDLEHYKAHEIRLILDNLNENSIAVQIGANIGFFPIVMAGKAKTVYAFEPDTKNYEICERNIQLNGVKNIVLSKNAIWDTDGTREFYEGIGPHSSFARFDENQTPIVVKTQRFDTLFKDTPVDLVHMDAIGSEFGIIRGFGSVRPKRILMGYDVRFLTFLNEAPLNLLRHVQGMGYDLYDLSSMDKIDSLGAYTIECYRDKNQRNIYAALI